MQKWTKKILLLVGFFFQISNLLPQSDNKLNNNFIEQIIENIAQSNDSELDYTVILEDLTFFAENPIDLNNTDANTLQQLYILNDMQINALLEHIEKNGKLLSIYELQGIDEFDLKTIAILLPFVKVDTQQSLPSLKTMLADSKHEILLRHSKVLETQQGYLSDLKNSGKNYYEGSPDHLYARYRMRYGNLMSTGITAEKDPGEKFGGQNQPYGFDFYSAHVFAKNINKYITAIAFGDYQLQFGQGLNIWSGLAFGKTANVLNVKRNEGGIKPYASFNENMFLRGTAMQFKLLKNWQITGFVSLKKIDANVSSFDTLTMAPEIVSSFLTTGYHRTPTELKNKGVNTEQIYGGNLKYYQKRLQIGFTAYRTKYSLPLQRNAYPYNRFYFSGDENTNASLDYQYLFRNFNFFGEYTLSQNGGFAFTNGLLVNLDTKISMVVLQRWFSKDYQGLLANPVREASTVANERGLLYGLLYKPSNKLTINAYMDYFKFQWLKYQVDSPSNGTEGFVQFNYVPNKIWETYFRFRRQTKAANVASEQLIDQTHPEIQDNYRLDFIYRLSKTWQLHSRIEMVNYQLMQKETGYLLFQDLTYKPMFSKFAFTCRYALFETDSYNSRIYAYESDVLNYFNIPAYAQRGTKTFIVINYAFTKNIKLWVRWAQTYLTNQNTIGSSLDMINGNTKNEIRTQLRITF